MLVVFQDFWHRLYAVLLTDDIFEMGCYVYRWQLKCATKKDTLTCRKSCSNYRRECYRNGPGAFGILKPIALICTSISLVWHIKVLKKSLSTGSSYPRMETIRRIFHHFEGISIQKYQGSSYSIWREYVN